MEIPWNTRVGISSQHALPCIKLVVNAGEGIVQPISKGMDQLSRRLHQQFFDAVENIGRQQFCIVKLREAHKLKELAYPCQNWQGMFFPRNVTDDNPQNH